LFLQTRLIQGVNGVFRTPQAGANVEDEPRVRPQQLSDPEAGRCSTGRVPSGHPHPRIGQGGGDQVSDEVICLQPVHELRVRGPVVATLPAELLPLTPEPRGGEDRPGFVE
jgi:hypothetical protein